MKSMYGQERIEAIVRIKDELNFAADTSLQDRLLAAHAYAKTHPQYSARMICEAGNIDQGTYRHFIKTGAHGNNGRVAHRRIVAEKIAELCNACDGQIGVGESVRQLNAAGIVCSDYLARDILNDMGYVTNPWSINGLEKLLEERRIIMG